MPRAIASSFSTGFGCGGLGAVMAVYLVGLLIYFGALQVLRFQQFRVDKELDARTGSYTNALQLKERVQVLQDQLNLKYAALDCWKVASELLPPDLTLTWLIFGKGINNQALTLHGIAPPDQASKLTDYNQALRDAAANGQPLFRNVLPHLPEPGRTVRAAMISWSFQCDESNGLGMNSYLDKLNLRPQERRLLVLVGLIVFVVLNFWFVRPHFRTGRRCAPSWLKPRRI